MIEFRNENENSAGNFNSVSMNGVKFYFSYQTCVAINLREGFEGRYSYTHKNDWSTTTGKHLNRHDGGWKDERVDGEMFERVCQEACRQVGLIDKLKNE